MKLLGSSIPLSEAHRIRWRSIRLVNSSAPGQHSRRRSATLPPWAKISLASITLDIFYGSFNSFLPVLCLFHTKRIMPFSFYHILPVLPAGFQKFCALHSSYAKIGQALSVIDKFLSPDFLQLVLTRLPQQPSGPRPGRCFPSGHPDPPGPCGHRRPACGKWACGDPDPG